MKVGDLVCSIIATADEVLGIIIETGVYTGNNDVKVMWSNKEITTYKSRNLRTIK
jgi:hypothetical protein|tara:strand:- start:278 stop:442 length:165 start_codon:yes stop_codon:yes gene_type:complete